MARDAAIIGELETRDTGKVIRETKAVTGYVAEFYRYFAGLADKIEGSTLPIDKPDMEVSTRREPLGVVAAVVPWNSQMFLTSTKLGPALAAGNTVVLKASEDGPAPLLHFAKLIHEAGFPAGVVNIITGLGADCGQVLTSHPLVARVAFTGGPDTARHVVRNTAANFAVTTLGAWRQVSGCGVRRCQSGFRLEWRDRGHLGRYGAILRGGIAFADS